MTDALLAVTLATVGAVVSVLGEGAENRIPIDGLGVGLVAASGLALAVRRRWPFVALAMTTVLTATYLLLGYPFGMIFVSFAVAVYTVARHRPLVRSAPVAVVAMAALLTHQFVDSQGALGLAYSAAWVGIPLAIGVSVRARREVAARVRADTIRAHVDDERLRVAQEVHDIVGHGLAAIKMQADIALHVLAKKPEQAQLALEAISRTSSEALDELRSTLAVVRQTGGDREAERSPAPGLARLDELRRRMGEAGLEVRVDTGGTPRTLPAVVDLAGYRIVQESLTNVLRHSGASQATVGLWYQTEAVEIVVANPVNGGSPQVVEGSGISGMRQRVHALGGTFSAGPTAGGRFEVRASLPTGGSE